jgi:hypothetical protein
MKASATGIVKIKDSMLFPPSVVGFAREGDASREGDSADQANDQCKHVSNLSQ